MINTRFWDDNYVSNLDPSEKLVFLYYLTNPATNISGVYEITLKRIALDTGFDKEMVTKITDRFIKDEKMIYLDGWVVLINFLKYQNTKSPTVIKGIENELKGIPESIIPYVYRMHTISHLNLNLNLNPNLNLKEKEEDNLIELNWRKKNINYILDFWNKQNLQQHRLKTVERHIKKGHWDIIADYDIEVVLKSIKNYSDIIKGDEYYFSFSWSLWDFIKRGLEKFIDDAKPFDNFKNSSNSYADKEELKRKKMLGKLEDDRIQKEAMK